MINEIMIFIMLIVFMQSYYWSLVFTGRFDNEGNEDHLDILLLYPVVYQLIFVLIAIPFLHRVHVYYKGGTCQ
jgi:hypothetical protein